MLITFLWFSFLMQIYNVLKIEGRSSSARIVESFAVSQSDAAAERLIVAAVNLALAPLAFKVTLKV